MNAESIEISNIEILEPTLDDVYLALTGSAGLAADRQTEVR
ncbi:hypothetical protein [Streptomyces laurentii]